FPQGGGMSSGCQVSPLLTPNHGLGRLSQEWTALGSAVAVVSLSLSSETSRRRWCSHSPYDTP
ncbi:unnamed protein product, partial [Bubo scandiacus]